MQFIFVIITIILAFAAYATHIISCIENAEYLFLLIGGILPIIGIISGVGLWVGAW